MINARKPLEWQELPYRVRIAYLSGFVLAAIAGLISGILPGICAAFIGERNGHAYLADERSIGITLGLTFMLGAYISIGYAVIGHFFTEIKVTKGE